MTTQQSAGPAPTDLRTDTLRVGPVSACLLAGDLTIDTERQAARALAAALHGGPAVLAVDLADVELFTCSGLNQLLVARRHAAAQGTDLVLVAPSRFVRRVLEITETTSLFCVVESIDAVAEDAVGRAAP
ncbi:STAS domain-containing protein [Kitasatospora sp. NPDC101801]|uniref:STAS domain-containing protein n=1 Tax=Kitasatospora sp. NPDC101801 TaxID=3364103 RepID=UPI003820A4C9